MSLSLRPEPYLARALAGGGGAPSSAITSLEVMGATPLLDATDDYGDATVRPGVNGNGWVVKVTVPYLVGQTFDPTKIVLSPIDPGFTESGTTTVGRTVRGTKVIRRQYSANASPQSANDGITFTVYFALADLIYDSARAISLTATAEAGFYGASQAGAVANVVNSSTRAYLKPGGGWLTLQHESCGAGGMYVEFYATSRYMRNGKPVPRVEIIGKDAQGTPNVAATQTVTSTTISTTLTQGQPPDCYAATIPVTNLTQSDLCRANAKVYPWIGDAAAVLDLEVDGVNPTGDWVTACPQTVLRFLNDKTGGYTGAHAAVKAGAVGGTVQASRALAVTTPFPTWTAAKDAVITYNNANKSHNDMGGAKIWMMEDSLGTGANHSTANSGITADFHTSVAGKTWLETLVDTDATGSVIMTMATTRIAADLCKWNIRIHHTAGNGFNANSGDNNKRIAFTSAVDLTGTTAGAPINYQFGLCCLQNLDIIFGGSTASNRTPGVGFSSAKMQLAYFCGVVSTDAGASPGPSPYFAVGNYTRRFTFSGADTTAIPTMASQDGLVFANNKSFDMRNTCVWGHRDTLTRGLFLIQDIFERCIDTSAPAIQLGGDGHITPFDNVVVGYITIPGGDNGWTRFNHAYTDANGAVGISKRDYLLYCILGQYNCKTEIFNGATLNKGRNGNWEVIYTVGHAGNVAFGSSNGDGTVNDTGSWLGSYWQTDSIADASTGDGVTYVDDNSGGSGTGEGDYKPNGASNEAYDRVPAGFAGLAHDINGVSRLNDGTGAAGAVER